MVEFYIYDCWQEDDFVVIKCVIDDEHKQTDVHEDFFKKQIEHQHQDTLIDEVSNETTEVVVTHLCDICNQKIKTKITQDEILLDIEHSEDWE